MKKTLISLFFCLCSLAIFAQKKLISGPMLGYAEHREAMIWLEVSEKAKEVQIAYWAVNNPQNKRFETIKVEQKAFNPLKIVLKGLDMNTQYQYNVLIDNVGVPIAYPTVFKTRDLWEWRKPAPDFTFLTGSCNYINDATYDRPGKPYGGNPAILQNMAKEKADFMLWLGDNLYLREADFSSEWGIQYRNSYNRASPEMQPLLAAMQHVAIWDDHDFGPNNGNSSYIFKDISRKAFMDYWANKTYGEENKGVYGTYSWADCDFFLLDDRYFRDSDDLKDEIDGKPNPDKKMWGAEQLRWLKNSMLTSNATFKFIVTGSQMLNPLSDFDCAAHYPIEYNDLLKFLEDYKVKGVVFLTGDRHHSEVIKKERNGIYPLYDVTNSPLTSGVSTARGKEKDNPARVSGTLVEAQNYTRVSVSGEKNKRILRFEFIDLEGKIAGSFQVSENDLKAP